MILEFRTKSLEGDDVEFVGVVDSCGLISTFRKEGKIRRRGGGNGVEVK